MLSFLKGLVIVQFAVSSLAKSYGQTDSYSGSGFNSGFSYQAIADPTHGRVNYVNSGTAASQNLTYASGDHFVLRADYKTTLGSGGAGRNSVRLQSKKQYTNGVMVFNIRHMPQGCGTWPAVWTVGSNWPNQGEVDIVEGVNDQGADRATLHTSSGCSMPSSRSQTGSSLGNNCDVAQTNNAGCGVLINDSRSFGPSFNNAGGGWFAMERTTSFIKVWFWSRNDGGIPSDVRNGASSVNTDNWGTPRANFPNTNCNIGQKFGPHNIIINLTFCGDWAGNADIYRQSGCPSSCVDYVNKNPGAFSNAYFDFQWLKIYA